jgi:transcription antitermination factor NusG
MQLAVPQTEEKYPWFGIRTKSRFEKITAAALAYKGYQTYLPLWSSRRLWSDRVVEIQAPLFTGYVFCCFDPIHRLPIIMTPGVVSIIGLGRDPAPIPDDEIEAIQAIQQSGLPAGPWPYLSEGERIRITRGALKNVEGVLVKRKTQWRLVVSLSLLQRSVAVEVDREFVSPIL